MREESFCALETDFKADSEVGCGEAADREDKQEAECASVCVTLHRALEVALHWNESPAAAPIRTSRRWPLGTRGWAVTQTAALSPREVPLPGAARAETRGGLSGVPAGNQCSPYCPRPCRRESLELNGFGFPWTVLPHGLESWGL